MSKENKNLPVPTLGEQLKETTKDSIKYVGGMALVVTLAANGGNHLRESERLDVDSTKIVKLDNGETVWDAASEVDASQTGKIVDYIIDNSPDLADGAHVGDEIIVPNLKDKK